MDAGLHGVEFEAHGRIASTVGKRRGKPSEKPENQGNPAFLFRIVKFADLAGIKSDRLLGVQQSLAAHLLDLARNSHVDSGSWRRLA